MLKSQARFKYRSRSAHALPPRLPDFPSSFGEDDFENSPGNLVTFDNGLGVVRVRCI